jgi:hypothetical protein
MNVRAGCLGMAAICICLHGLRLVYRRGDEKGRKAGRDRSGHDTDSPRSRLARSQRATFARNSDFMLR